MRDAIRTRLMDQVDSLKNVWQPGMADQHAEKPYAVVKFEFEFEENIDDSYARPIQVWLYASREDYNDIDSLVEQSIEALTNVDLVTQQGNKYRLRCSGVSADGFFDPDLKAITKTVFFTQYILRH